MAEYVEYIQPSIQIYFGVNALKWSLIASVFMYTDHAYNILPHMFGFSGSVSELDKDDELGLSISETHYNSVLPDVLKDLFEDIKSKYFVDENGYADVALQLIKSMTQGSE